MTLQQIKSRDRVRDLAEVYTNAREVNAMLDLIPIKNNRQLVEYRYLEPTCGNGNFLIEILRRKINAIHSSLTSKTRVTDYELRMLKALSTIYGIDICAENINESRLRLLCEIKSAFNSTRGTLFYSEGFIGMVHYILNHNIVVGDTLNNKGTIKFTEFSFNKTKIGRKVFIFDDLVNEEPQPVEVYNPIDYQALGHAYLTENNIAFDGAQQSLF
jgi:hypothetical protein